MIIARRCRLVFFNNFLLLDGNRSLIGVEQVLRDDDHAFSVSDPLSQNGDDMLYMDNV